MPGKYEYEGSHFHFNKKVIKYSYWHWAMAKTLLLFIQHIQCSFYNSILFNKKRKLKGTF